ncbi:sigma 54-interacting transcriptional regulator [Myxococcota bacterium]|nr:sigma 54-interacting transcriptional regulator [Myxococcota bacterium]
MAADPAGPFVLCIAHHPRTDLVGRRIFLLAGQQLELGRGGQALGPDALLDPRMSRRHARLFATEDALWIEDLGSRNGTLVDGHPVRRGRLRPGTVVGLGRILLQAWRMPAEQAARGVLGGAPTPPLVAESPTMRPVMDAVLAAASDRTPVLIVGEDGVGKSVVAQAIHRASRPEGPLVVLPVAALRDEEVEHALHGSAADPSPTGALARAEGGTLVLPRLDVARPALHAALRAFLEDGMLRPRGGAPRPVSLRVVVTTVRDPAAMVRAGDLSDALYSHLRKRLIAVPRLRDRREDILPLARHLFHVHAGQPTPMDRLLALLLALHDWPGNTTELEGVVRRIAAEQAGAVTFRLPPWGAEVFGPRATEVVSTFDPALLGGRRSRP